MPKGHFQRSEEHKRHISEALTGKPKSPEHVAKVAAAQRGRKMSDEWLAQTRERLRLHPPKKGVVLGKEARARMSEQRKGKTDKLKKYGISRAEYAEKIAAGLRWCGFSRHFVSKQNFSPTNHQGVCLDCMPLFTRRYELKRRFGVTLEWYQEKLAQQGGGCAICGRAPAPTQKAFSVDHNHETGAVRGILCVPCNTLLERLDKTPEWMNRACAYLRAYAA